MALNIDASPSQASYVSAISNNQYDHYPLNRDAKEAARLNHQHGILIKSFGFLIHPSILPGLIQSPDVVRIADFATGTAIWPFEVATFFKETVPDLRVKVSGFDVSKNLFPALETLPNGVHLHTHDITKPMKEKYHGRFDLINVRALVTALGNDQWEGAVVEIVKCLKPGGWVQWIDGDMSPSGWKCMAHESKDLAVLDPLRKLYSGQIPNPIAWGIQVVNCWAEKLNRSLDSSGNLPKYFDANGLKDVQHEVLQVDGDKELRTEFTVEIAEAASAIFERYAKMLAAEEINPDWTIEDAYICGQEMVHCAREKIFWGRMDFNIVTGRKPVPSAVDAYVMEQVKIQMLQINPAEPNTVVKLQETSQHLVEVYPEPGAEVSPETFQRHELNGGAKPFKTTQQAVKTTDSNRTAKEQSVDEQVIGFKNFSHETTTTELASCHGDIASTITEGPAEQGVDETPIFQPRKLLPHEMGAVKKLVQAKNPIPHSTQAQVKKHLPHDPPTKNPLPHEIACARKTTSQSTDPLTLKALPETSQPSYQLPTNPKALLPHELAVNKYPPNQFQSPHLKRFIPHERTAQPKEPVVLANKSTNAKDLPKEIAKRAGDAAVARMESEVSGKRKLMPHEMGL